MAIERLAEQAWRLPERRINSGSVVTFRSEINEESIGLSPAQITDLNCGIYALGSEIGGGSIEPAKIWGYEFERGGEPNTQIVRHRRPGEREVIGTVRIGKTGPFLPEIVLIKAESGE